MSLSISRQNHSPRHKRGFLLPAAPAAAQAVTEEEAMAMYGDPTVRYEGPTLNFNSDAYVPKEAVPGLINQASKQARAQVFNDMRNKPATRRQLGMG